MRIEFFASGVEPTHALRRHIRRRLRLVLGSFSSQVESVRVNVNSNHGPEGRLSGRCRIQVFLDRRRSATVEKSDLNLQVAIDSAIDSTGRVVARFLHGKAPWLKGKEAFRAGNMAGSVGQRGQKMHTA